MQTVIVSDVDRIRPRAYIHHHKCHSEKAKQQGPNEVMHLWEDVLLPMCLPNNKFRGRPLFREKPHMTWDNFYSGDNIMEYAHDQGFGFTCTVRRDRLPKGIPSKYWHKEKTNSTWRPKAARFLQPIFAIKQRYDDVQSTMHFISFQSTSSCNFACVNALNSCGLYAKTKFRGCGRMKRQWAIEMNEGRDLYLNTYGTIDRMDHLITNCDMGYR